MEQSGFEYSFDNTEDAIDAIRRGELIVVMDDESRENEGDLILAAEHATPEKVAFMIRYTSGILCVPITTEIANDLDIPMMVANNTDPKKTAFTVSVDVEGTTTGVSAEDRTKTIRALADPTSTAAQFRKPGHIFPLVARPGGVLVRRGHTEASVDLCLFAGLRPVALLAEITNKDGTMSRLKECHAFAKKHGLCITTVEALVEYKKQLTDKSAEVELLAECEVPVQRRDKYLGMWSVRCYRSLPDGLERHVALVKGDVAGSTNPVLTRIHSECFTSHVLGSARCDCSEQLDIALGIINDRGCGVAIYVDGHEGRGIGLHNKLKAYSLQHSKQLDTYEANTALGFGVDLRKYDTPRAILRHLGIQNIDIMTNNPTKIEAFRDMIKKVTPLRGTANEHNLAYLEAKREYERNVAASAITLAGEQKKTSELATDPHLVKEIPIRLPSPANIARLRIGIIRTSWNESLVGSLADQCKKSLLQNGVQEANLLEGYDVPGSFELPFVAHQLARSGRVDAVVCFGVLIKGETMHFEYISNAVSQGLMQVQLTTGIPVIYGVLNCLTLDQAWARCGPSSPLPMSLAATAIRMASLYVEGNNGKSGILGLDPNCSLSAPLLQPCAQG